MGPAGSGGRGPGRGLGWFTEHFHMCLVKADIVLSSIHHAATEHLGNAELGAQEVSSGQSSPQP